MLYCRLNGTNTKGYALTSQQRALRAEQQKLGYLWNARLRPGFEVHSADQDQDVPGPLVNQVPVMGGGSGRKNCTNLTPNISCRSKKGKIAISSATHSFLKRDRDRTSALVAGLAATVATWTIAVAFAPERLSSVPSYSPWCYVPVATAVWALFSAIAFLLVAHGGDRRTPSDLQGYRCPELAMPQKPNGHSLCANQNEQIRLGAVTASLALTIAAWVGALSFMPEDWIDWLGNSPAWICCVASMVLWSILSAAMFLVFRGSSEKSGEPPRK
jgi:hypothetical protein